MFITLNNFINKKIQDTVSIKKFSKKLFINWTKMLLVSCDQGIRVCSEAGSQSVVSTNLVRGIKCLGFNFKILWMYLPYDKQIKNLIELRPRALVPWQRALKSVNRPAHSDWARGAETCSLRATLGVSRALGRDIVAAGGWAQITVPARTRFGTHFFLQGFCDLSNAGLQIYR